MRTESSIGYAACPTGYVVQIIDQNGSILDTKAKTYVDPRDGIGLDLLWQFAEKTAKETATELNIDHAFVYRDDDLSKSLETKTQTSHGANTMKELLEQYQRYVGHCIKLHSDEAPLHPMSFDEWHHFNKYELSDDLAEYTHCGLSIIATKCRNVAMDIAKRACFITYQDHIETLAPNLMLLIRTGRNRYRIRAKDLHAKISEIEESDDYLRDVSLLVDDRQFDDVKLD